MERLEVRAADGWRLSACKVPHRGARRGAVLALPAMMVDARTLRARRGRGGRRAPGLAESLADHGLDVVVADFRGHGGSGPAAPVGSWTYDDLVYRDIPALADLARGEGPLYLLGHSLGGHAGAAAAVSGAVDVDGLVLLASNVWMPSLEPSRRRALRKGCAMAAFLAVSRAAGRFPSRRLRVGSVDEALPYVEDLARFWREDAWRDRRGRDWLAEASGFSRPVLQLTGRADTLMGHVDGVRAWTRAFPRHEVRHVGRGDHDLPFDPDHMGIAADPRSAPLWSAIGRWLAEQATAR